VGLPLSSFDATVGTGFPPGQVQTRVAYWDIGASPGEYDNNDVAYLQFGSYPGGPLKVVKTNDIRLTAWGNYPAGSYVKAGDLDMGQSLIPQGIVPPLAVDIGFYYMNVAAGIGYDLEDPVYLKIQNPILRETGTNDIRITPNAGFPAGSKVSLSDPDAARPLTAFVIPYGPTGGPLAQGTGPINPLILPVARLRFFNANGNTAPFGAPIYDDGDVVYFDVAPLDVVSPNDIRMF
jgi:hypothetical protein